MPAASRGSSTLRALGLTTSTPPSRSFHSSSVKMSNLANFKVPAIFNEPNKHYTKGSPDREGLASALSAFGKKAPIDIPLVIGGKSVSCPSMSFDKYF